MGSVTLPLPVFICVFVQGGYYSSGWQLSFLIIAGMLDWKKNAIQNHDCVLQPQEHRMSKERKHEETVQPTDLGAKAHFI